MGASVFFTRSSGKDIQEAFRRAVDRGFYDHGHGGYSGTIAEKESFIEIAVPDGDRPEDFAERLVGEDDPRIFDKWGPAAAVNVGPGEWLFFGWASS